MSEHREQVEFVSWFRREYPQHLIYSIPNGDYRGDRRTAQRIGAKLKAEGLLKGVSDLHVPSLGLWIEMKEHAKKKPTKEQLEWGEHVQSFGNTFFVGYGYEDAKQKVIEFMNA